MKFIVLLVSITFSLGSMAQHPVFSQVYANPLYLNPALAGSKECPKIYLNYRNQWPSLSGGFTTTSIAYDQYANKLSGGIGFQMMHDVSFNGVLQNTSASAIYSYHFKLSDQLKLAVGAQAGWTQRFIDFSRLTFGEMIDPTQGFVYPSGEPFSGKIINDHWGTKGYLDFSSGLVLFSEVFHVGAAVKHLSQPKSGFYSDGRLPVLFSGHASVNFNLNEAKTMLISPSLIYAYQGGFQRLSAGATFQANWFTFGTWYSSRDAIVFQAGFKTRLINFGYSYDITVSLLTNQSGGAHELSLGVNLPCKKRNENFLKINTPDF